MFGHEYRPPRYAQPPVWTHRKQVAPSSSRKTTKTTLVSPTLRKHPTSAPPTIQKKSTSDPPIPENRATRASLARARENYNRLYGNPAMTMTGLPWEVRHNPTGRVRFPEKKILPPVRPRMGTYNYTYGLADPENDQESGVIHPSIASKPNSSKTQGHSHELDFPETVKRFLDLKSGATNNLAKSGYSPSLSELMKQTGNPLTPSESSKELKDLEALWDDIRDDIGSTVKESESVSPSEIAAAASAFDWPASNSQNAQPTKFHVNHPMHKGQGRTDKKVRIPEPSLGVFQQSYRLLPHLQEKLIENQIKKEFASQNIVPSGTQYMKRKEELMEAAYKVGYNQKSSATVFPDLVQEYNYKDLFQNQSEDDDQDFNVITRPAYTISQENPKRHIQTLSPLILDSKDVKLRQRRKESIMGTVLREMAQSKNQVAEDDVGTDEPELPPRRRTKDQEKNRQMALRALENYRLIQERQKALIHRVPQITVQRHGPQLGDKIPQGSEYHQMALGHSHRSHPPQLQPIEQKTKYISQSKPSGTVKGKPTATTLGRQNQQYPTHMGSRGLPGPPPPISEIVLPGSHRYHRVGKKGTKTKTDREDSGYRPDDYDDDD